MITSYLELCPLRGRYYALTLLPQRTAYNTHDDNEVLAIAEVLHDMDWYEASSHVLITRGMYWLSRSRCSRVVDDSNSNNIQQGRDHNNNNINNNNNNNKNKKRNNCDDNETYLNRSTLAKAAYFFQLSGDISRLEYIIDSSLSRCMLAVRSCEKFFEHLLLFPTLNSLSKPYLRTNLSSSSNTNHGRDNTIEHESDAVIELEAALIEANDLLVSIDFDDENNLIDSSNISTDPYSLVIDSFKYLKIYIEAIECRFKPKNRYDVKKPFMKAIVLLSSLIIDRDNDDHDHASKEKRKKVDAVLPMRYWLHTLELIVWFFNSISKVQSNYDDDTGHVVDQKDIMVDNANDNGKGIVIGDDDDDNVDNNKVKNYCLSKKQAYGLVIALQQLTCSYGIHRFIMDANIGNNLNGDSHSNVGFEDSISQLRLGLLGILCHSMIKDNANVYKDSLKDKKSMLSPFFKTTSSATPTTAYSTTTNLSTITSKVTRKGKYQLETTSTLKIGRNVNNSSFRYDQNGDNYINNKNNTDDERTEYDYQIAYEIITGSMVNSIV